MKTALVILAAGIGNRYGGLKQITGVGPSGEALVDYSLFDAMRAGFGKVVFIIRKKIEKDFREFIGKKLESMVDVEYVFQELSDVPAGCTAPPGRVKPWGTSHAVLMCRDAISEPFGVINADDFYGRSAYEILQGFLAKADNAGKRYCVVGFRLGNTLSDHGAVARGVCETDANGLLTGIAERTKIEKTPTGARYLDEDENWQALTGRETVSMNMWGFTPAIFDELERSFSSFIAASEGDPKAELYIPASVDEMIQAGTASVEVLESDSQWFGMTYREDTPVVVESMAKLVEAGEYPADLALRS